MLQETELDNRRALRIPISLVSSRLAGTKMSCTRPLGAVWLIVYVKLSARYSILVNKIQLINRSWHGLRDQYKIALEVKSSRARTSSCSYFFY